MAARWKKCVISRSPELRRVEDAGLRIAFFAVFVFFSAAVSDRHELAVIITAAVVNLTATGRGRRASVLPLSLVTCLVQRAPDVLCIASLLPAKIRFVALAAEIKREGGLCVRQGLPKEAVRGGE